MSNFKLNIGGGNQNRLDNSWFEIDRKFGTEAYPLPVRLRYWPTADECAYHELTDDSVSEIRASHILEHFDLKTARLALADWHRVLKPGGTIKIAVPDFDKISNGEFENDPKRMHYLFGGGVDENDHHGWAYTRASLTEELERVGFDVLPEPWVSEIEDCASLPVSLNVEAVKSDPVAPVGQLDLTGTKIIAVASILRLGFNDHWGCIHEALVPMGIAVWSVSGAYWGQTLQRGLTEAVDKGADWLLTLDYDTLFTAKQVQRLCYDFQRNPHIDALAALQPRRRTGAPLMTVGASKDTMVESNGDPISAKTAHFGLTLIRTKSLLEMEKPWFNSSPGADGEWTSPDHIDDDIWFWKKWEAAGKTLFVSPEVRVGHLEMMCSHYPDGVAIGAETRTFMEPREWIRIEREREMANAS